MLLDSHVLLWLLTDSDRLGRDARAAVRSDAPIHVSAATMCEFVIKSMIGKLVIPPRLDERLVEQGYVRLPITAAHALAMTGFPTLAGHDPFDRIILAQARQEGLALLTADRTMLSLGQDWIVDARR